VDVLKKIPELEPLLLNADHVDVKTAPSRRSLREFVARLLGWQPAWITFLYRIRALFVRCLGMRQEGLPHPIAMRPEEVPFGPGESLSFWTIKTAREDHYWVAEAVDTHLSAFLVVAVEPAQNQNRFHVATIVHYRKWTGPVYFNVIRPFHHLVVWCMIRRAAAGE
jgi:hypothetical protein